MTIEYEDQVRYETIEDLSLGLVRLTMDMLELHGPDPENDAIIVASFNRALQDIGTIYPQVPLTVSIMVQEDAARQR